MEEEIATDRKFEFIQVLQRKLTERIAKQSEWVNIMEVISNMAAYVNKASVDVIRSNQSCVRPQGHS